MTKPIQRIVIVGRDECAWIAALVLLRHVKSAKLKIEVELVETPSGLSEHDVFSVLPTHRALIDLMGVTETAMLRKSGAQISMGQRFSNWSSAAPAFMHAYDVCGVPLESIKFLQYWLAAQQAGLNVPLEEFCLGAVAAKQGKVVAAVNAASQFSQATYGYNLVAKEFVQLVAAQAVGAGLKCRSATIGKVNVINGHIESILLGDGDKIRADLYIDATGQEAILSSAIAPDGLDTWTPWFLCDSEIVTSTTALNPMPAFSEIVAMKAGWIGLFPSGDKTGVRITFASDQISAQEAIDNAMVITGLKFSGAVKANKNVNIRRAPWQANCIAMGNANASLDGLDAVDLSALQLGMTYLLMLMPVSTNYQLEATLYNQKMASHLERIRDFQLAHYKLNQRRSEPLWDAAREVSVPEALQHKMALFSANGEVAMLENEVFQDESWIAAFIGHGLIPEQYNALVNKVPKEAQIQVFQNILKTIASEVTALPTLDSYMQMC